MANPRNKTKIALVKPANESLEMWTSWCDGLYGAMQELSQSFNVKVFGYCDTPAVLSRGNIEIQLSSNASSLKYWLNSFNPSYTFGWGTAFHDWDELSGVGGKKRILLYAGGAYDKKNAYSHFDMVVVENESDKVHFDTDFHAFGTNTDVFKPMLELDKFLPSLYPAAFALYKRHALWASAMPSGSLAVGHMQDHEAECYEVCIENAHMVMPALPMTSLPYLYNQSLGVCLTAENMGGCQRSALEAMACNVPVLVTNDSKASEFEGVWTCPPIANELSQAYAQMVIGFENGDFNLREDYILGKYDHKTYAKTLKELL